MITIYFLRGGSIYKWNCWVNLIWIANMVVQITVLGSKGPVKELFGLHYHSSDCPSLLVNLFMNTGQLADVVESRYSTKKWLYAG